MSKFPLIFEVFSEADPAVNSPWEVKKNSFECITCCVPPELKGSGGGYTPEDLFALSIINCIIADFKVFCEKASESFKKIKIKAKLVLDEQSNQKLILTGIDIEIDVEGASNSEKIKKILDESINHCPVSHTIKIPKTLHINVS